MQISSFLASGNNWRDAFVVVPTEYNGWFITEIDISFGDTWPTSNSNFRIEMRDGNNNPTFSAVYQHTGNTRAEVKKTSIGDFQTFPVIADYTLNVYCVDQSEVPAGDDTCRGYTVSIKLDRDYTP